MLRCVLKRLALLVLACAVSGAWAADPGEQKGGASRDAAQWGIYAGLGGTAWRGSTDPIAWEWAPDGSLTETFGNFTSRTVPGDKPGHLVREYSKAHVYDGYVAADGSVLWIRRGTIKSPTRWSISQGRVVAERVKLDDERRVAAATALWTFEPTTASATSPVAEAPVAQAAAPVVASVPDDALPAPSRVAPIDLEWLNASIGQSFIGNNDYGTALTLDIYREGDAIALHSGYPGGNKAGRILLRPTETPGRFQVLENWEGTSNENAYAYVAGSAAAPPDPLDTYYADPRKPGDLVVGFDIRGGYLVLTIHPDAGGWLSIQQVGGKRTFGIRRAIGDIDYVSVKSFSPATAEATRHVLAYADARRQQRENERREDEAFEAEQQQRVASAAYESLVAANAVASANEAQSRAALDATLDQAARQAAYERQQSASPSWSTQDVQNANAATARQEAIARDYAAQRAAASDSAPVPANAGQAAAAPASVRDRADTCVGQPVTASHKCASTTGLIGRVANSCAVHVDVRMCFMTATGWSCQSNYGLAPEQAWEPGDCKATGQVFRSVRYSDSKEPLAYP